MGFKPTARLASYHTIQLHNIRVDGQQKTGQRNCSRLQETLKLNICSPLHEYVTMISLLS